MAAEGYINDCDPPREFVNPQRITQSIFPAVASLTAYAILKMIGQDVSISAGKYELNPTLVVVLFGKLFSFLPTARLSEIYIS